MAPKKALPKKASAGTKGKGHAMKAPVGQKSAAEEHGLTPWWSTIIDKRGLAKARPYLASEHNE